MERGLEDMSSILKVEDLVKYYGEGENQVRAVDHTSLQIETYSSGWNPNQHHNIL